MKISLTKIVARTLLLVGVFVLVVVSAGARDSEAGITFATYGIDLKIDSESTYNGVFVPSGTWALKNLVSGVDKFFNFDDIKPGDSGENTISMHVKKADAWLCLDFKNLQSSDNNQNEPEAVEDANSTTKGELAEGMEFFAWIDDGDNVFEKKEKPIFGPKSASEVLDDKTYSLGDSKSGNSCKINETRYIGIYWCAGDLSVNLNTTEISCDGSVLGNEAQTDSMSVDVSIRAVPAKENLKFMCEGESDKTEGCSPGYWKQSQHFGEWTSPYTPSTLFSSVFDNAFPGKTLLQVLELNGGGLSSLGRQAVAALLNSANPDVNFAFTTAEVINMFNTVFPGGNYESLKNTFEKQNTISCPLSNSKPPKDDDDDYSKPSKDENYDVDIKVGGRDPRDLRELRDVREPREVRPPRR